MFADFFPSAMCKQGRYLKTAAEDMWSVDDLDEISPPIMNLTACGSKGVKSARLMSVKQIRWNI